MRGKQWSFIRPVKEGAVIRFLNSSGETFGAKYQAQAWLHEHGYRYGSSDWGPYIPAIKAEKYDLPQKLYNFDLEDYKRVNAVMYSQDYRDGWVEVWLVEYMCCLDLPLKYKWFDMIDRGEKLEEYRDKKWLKRLRLHEYTHIRFRRGYTSRTAIFRYDGFRFGTPKPGWCEPEDEGKELLVIKIGERYK